MTRKEQIKMKADKYCKDEWTHLGFVAGAEWADAHPNWEEITKRLQEEITNDLRQDRWISVEDELPHGGVYLFCNSNGDVFIASDEIAFLYKNVTHWMPLPAPPKEIRGNRGEIPPNQQQIIGTPEHIKTALDVMDKKGGEQ